MDIHRVAMCLHPAVGMTLQRVVPAGGRVIGRRFYPEGTLVGMAAREIHYDIRAYGKDAEKWCPERWLEGDRNELENYNLVVRLFRAAASEHLRLIIDF